MDAERSAGRTLKPRQLHRDACVCVRRALCRALHTRAVWLRRGRRVLGGGTAAHNEQTIVGMSQLRKAMVQLQLPLTLPGAPHRQQDQRAPEGQSMHTCTHAQGTVMGLHPAAAALLRGCTERAQAGVSYVIAYLALLLAPSLARARQPLPARPGPHPQMPHFTRPHAHTHVQGRPPWRLR
jgi:hypothetical protein